jgi:hypothetical protein
MTAGLKADYLKVIAAGGHTRTPSIYGLITLASCAKVAGNVCEMNATLTSPWSRPGFF